MVFDQYFYHPDLAQNVITLSREESEHCVRALRHRAGDRVLLTDGLGHEATALIVAADPKACMVELSEVCEVRAGASHRLHLAIAPTKNMDRMEWLVEKCVEMGIDRIIPLRCHNSERTVLKTERLKKIMVSAMKQSLKATLPRLDEMTPVEQVLAEPFDGIRCIAYCDEMLPRDERSTIAGVYRPGQDVMILIGPEGDFSPEEVRLSRDVGFVPVTLGESRLRTETAGMMAVTAVHALDMTISR